MREYLIKDGAGARGLSVDLLDRLRAVRLAGGARA